MHVYKRLIYALVIIYLLIIIAMNFFIKNKNLNQNYINNKIEKINESFKNEKKIIVFGRSTCEFGIESAKFEKKFDKISFNLCSSAYEYEDNFLLNEITKKLSVDDVVIYSKRIPFENENKSLNLFSNFFIPNLFGTLRSLKNYNSRNDEILNGRETNINKNGDKIDFNKRQANFDIIDYKKTNYNFTKINLINQLKEVERIKKKNNINILVVAPPILANKNDRVKLEQIIEELKKQNLNSNIEWIAPVVLSEKKYFIDDDHVNEKGREIWTEYLINKLYNNLN